MSKTAEKTDPKLWKKVKDEVTKGDKGGKPDQWSARKAQMASAEYKKEGGGYKGGKTADNHLQQWSDEDWGTKSGKESGETGERYLPKEAREHLSDAEYKKTSDKKRSDTADGKQHSPQPEAVAQKTAAHRDTGKSEKPKGSPTRADLYAQAKAKGIPGRSRMSRADLAKALG